MSLGVFADCGVVASKLLELLEHQEIAPTFAFHRNHRGRLDSFLLPNRKGGDPIRRKMALGESKLYFVLINNDQVLPRTEPKHLLPNSLIGRAS
jgi:hypothetical protein